MVEEWRDVPGYEGIYQVSDLGRIKRLAGSFLCPNGRILRPTSQGYRYWGVTLHRNGKRRRFAIHRLVALVFMGLRADQDVDHINRDASDNRIVNLRLCTQTQNNYNAGKRKNSRSPYKGVRKNGRRWQAYIMVAGKTIILGQHDTPEAANEAYLAAAKRYAGEFARAK